MKVQAQKAHLIINHLLAVKITETYLKEATHFDNECQTMKTTKNMVQTILHYNLL